jgi:hypothetical protein
MARYNTATQSQVINTTATVGAPYQGVFTKFTGTPPYTVTLPNPVLYPGQQQQFYNATTGVVTLQAGGTATFIGIGVGTSTTTPTGQGAPGGTTFTMEPNSSIRIVSDGTNYVIIGSVGGPKTATELTTTSTTALTPSGFNVTIFPTGAGQTIINSGTTGSMDNIIIGANCAVAATFTCATIVAQPTALTQVANKCYVDRIARKVTASEFFISSAGGFGV